MSKYLRITFLGFAVAMICIFSATLQAADQPNNASQAFVKLKGLVGQWEATTDKGKVSSSYELTANGTVLLEKTKVPNMEEMVTVYHLDGKKLVLTHYCMVGNQPHMQAEAFDPASQQIRFDFAGAGNLASPNDGHMHTAVFKFVGPDAFNTDWTFFKEGKAAFVEQIQFHRVR